MEITKEIVEENKGYYITIAGEKLNVRDQYSDDVCAKIRNNFVLETTDILYPEFGGMEKYSVWLAAIRMLLVVAVGDVPILIEQMESVFTRRSVVVFRNTEDSA